MPWADNNGMRIWYEARGEGEPLVLLHGFTSSSAHWKVYGYASALCAAATDRANLEPALEGLRVPLMMFVGDLDQRLPAVQQAAQKMDALLAIVPGIAHAGTLSASEVLIPEIRSFLASL